MQLTKKERLDDKKFVNFIQKTARHAPGNLARSE